MVEITADRITTATGAVIEGFRAEIGQDWLAAEVLRHLLSPPSIPTVAAIEAPEPAAMESPANLPPTVEDDPIIDEPANRLTTPPFAPDPDDCFSVADTEASGDAASSLNPEDMRLMGQSAADDADTPYEDFSDCDEVDSECGETTPAPNQQSDPHVAANPVPLGQQAAVTFSAVGDPCPVCSTPMIARNFGRASKVVCEPCLSAKIRAGHAKHGNAKRTAELGSSPQGYVKITRQVDKQAATIAQTAAEVPLPPVKGLTDPAKALQAWGERPAPVPYEPPVTATGIWATEPVVTAMRTAIATANNRSCKIIYVMRKNGSNQFTVCTRPDLPGVTAFAIVELRNGIWWCVPNTEAPSEQAPFQLSDAYFEIVAPKAAKPKAAKIDASFFDEDED